MDAGAVYSDFGSLASLKADAAANPNAALEEVAEQFESIFVQMMLKSMRDATVKGDLFNSNQMDTYMSMADQQIALNLSQNGGIGLARMLVEQMQTRGMVEPSAIDGLSGVKPAATDLRLSATGAQEAIKAFQLAAANTSTGVEED